MTVSAAILAGGKNLRMGKKNKAFLEIGGRSFMARTMACLEPIFDEIMVIGHDREDYGGFGVPVYPDLRPGNGSLGGILTALDRSSSERTFCVACDMPFLKPAVVSYLVEKSAEGWDAVLPRLSPGIEPLCAVYSSSLMPVIEKLLDRGELRVRRALDGGRVCYVEEDELRSLDPGLATFVNINTPDEMLRASALEEEAHT